MELGMIRIYFHFIILLHSMIFWPTTHAHLIVFFSFYGMSDLIAAQNKFFTCLLQKLSRVERSLVLKETGVL